MNENDWLWEKVESKLDRIYEYQKQISTNNIDSEDKKNVYNKFGDAIVSLVQNLINGKTEETKVQENKDVDQMLLWLNEKIEKAKWDKFLISRTNSSGKLWRNNQ